MRSHDNPVCAKPPSKEKPTFAAKLDKILEGLDCWYNFWVECGTYDFYVAIKGEIPLSVLSEIHKFWKDLAEDIGAKEGDTSIFMERTSMCIHLHLDSFHKLEEKDNGGDEKKDG